MGDRLFRDFDGLTFAIDLHSLGVLTTFLVSFQSSPENFFRFLIQNKILIYITLLSDLAKTFCSILNWGCYSSLQKSFTILYLKSLFI